MLKSSVLDVSSEQEFNQIIHGNKDKLVVVDFSASWCGPCKAIAPVVHQMAYMYNGCVFVKVDIDHAPALANRYQVQGVPTFLFFKNGSVIHQFSGANAAELEATLKLHGSVVPSQSNPPPSNKSPGINLSSIPTSSFSLIPQRGWIQFDAAKPEMILQKLQDSSTKLSSNDTTKNQALTAVEGRLLLGLCNTVKKMDSQLLAEQMKLPSAKLLRWPTEMLWPVVDLLRLLVLHPQGSQFVAEHALKDGDEFNCVDVVLSFLLDEPQKELAMMCWRFICNLFATPALQHSAVQIIDQIASIAQLFISDPTPAVRSHVAAALLNSAVAALATRANNETRTSIAEACICLLKQEQDATNVDRLLAALGTACYGAEHILEKHLSSLRQLPLVAKGTSQAAQEFTKFAKL